MGVAIRYLGAILNQVEAKSRLLITRCDAKSDDHSDGYRSEQGSEDIPSLRCWTFTPYPGEDGAVDPLGGPSFGDVRAQGNGRPGGGEMRRAVTSRGLGRF